MRKIGSEEGKDEVQDSENGKEVQNFWDNLLVQKMSLRCRVLLLVAMPLLNCCE